MGHVSGFLLHKPEGALRCSSSPDSDETALVSPMCESQEGDVSQEFNDVISLSEIPCSGALPLAELGRQTD